jgi:superfamily II DNA or RNA helicase
MTNLQTTDTTVQYLQQNLIVDSNNEIYNNYFKKAQKHYQELCNLYNLEVRPYQPEMAALYALRGSNICGGACGLGKTFIVGLLICILYSDCNFKGGAGQIQIAVPNILSGKTRWLTDLNRLTALKGKVEFINSETQALKSNKPIWVYTTDFIKRKSKYIKGNRDTIARCFKRRGLLPSLLVIDEIHLLKPNSDRSKLWIWWRKQCKRFLGLSGTLSDGRLDLLIHIAELVYGNTLTYTKSSFIDKFNVNKVVNTNYLKGEEQVNEVSTRYLPHLDITKLPQYAEFAQTYIHRVSLNDPNVTEVIKIPECIEHHIKIAPTLTHKQYYLDLLKDIKQRLEAAQTANWTIALNTINPLINASNITPPDITNNKLNKLINLVDNNSGKTVIFVSQIEIGRVLHNHLKDLYGADKAIRLYAQDPNSNPKVLNAIAREDLVSKFLYDDKVKVGVFSINLASESIDLNTASQVIFYDYPWQAIKLQQAIYRAVRPGNPIDKVHVYYLVNSGMIDAHQFNLLNERKKSTKTMLDFDPTNLLECDLSILDTNELIKQTLATTDLLEQLELN